MKIVKKNPKYDHGLMKFIKQNCPPSLETIIDSNGYGLSCTVRRKDFDSYKIRNFWGKVFDIDCRPIIATIETKTVTLNDPQYYSDFESLCKEYEEHTGKEVTLVYWES